ncbi:hypothetical protein LSH36_359g00063 [Paralvinella palmiformis]|uniref:Alpha-2-macroglobulin bait region domain-containing protein n=1 Tax=Paralvinella palmiformis TaxID=53620 RepID=A0AAD9JFP2_9ANNE|nr:hypothetical protein LSH36_359g00063 [Paralvinella palmiformis]
MPEVRRCRVTETGVTNRPPTVAVSAAGLINISYPLSEQPILGTWTVVAQVQGQLYKRQFDILKYVLPKYEVTIDAPPYIRDWNACKRIEVKARYTFGQDVHGMVKMQAAVRGIGYYSAHSSSTIVQRSKIDGVAAFNVCISDLIHTRFPDHFRGQLHLVAEVTTPDGSIVRATDDSCPVNKQLVDLRFSRDTRTTFKPGLPFKGRVLVQYADGSSADNVTVLVDAVVDGIDFSRQSLTSSHGHAQFYIPPLPTIAQSMAISAKVLSIEEELVPESYFSAYLTVTSWYSPSKCHLLIESKNHKYKVGEEGRFMIHSTCPCNLDMYYEVKARGNIVYSGIHFSRHQHKHTNPTTDTSKFPIYLQHLQNEGYGAKTCTVFIKFLITHEMAPVSRLLVYYIRPGGEGVADAIVFETEPDFRNKVIVRVRVEKLLSDPY